MLKKIQVAEIQQDSGHSLSTNIASWFSTNRTKPWEVIDIKYAKFDDTNKYTSALIIYEVKGT